MSPATHNLQLRKGLCGRQLVECERITVEVTIKLEVGLTVNYFESYFDSELDSEFMKE